MSLRNGDQDGDYPGLTVERAVGMIAHRCAAQRVEQHVVWGGGRRQLQQRYEFGDGAFSPYAALCEHDVPDLRVACGAVKPLGAWEGAFALCQCAQCLRVHARRSLA